MGASFSHVAETCLSSRDSCSASPTKALRGPPGPQGTTSPSTTHRVHHGERRGSSCALEKKNLLQPLACLLQPLSQPMFQPLSETLLRPLFQTLFQSLFQPLCQPLSGGLVPAVGEASTGAGAAPDARPEADAAGAGDVGDSIGARDVGDSVGACDAGDVGSGAGIGSE